MEDSQKHTGNEDEQSLCGRGYEEPPFLSVGVVGETKAKSGKEKAKEQEAAEGDGCEAKLTSCWMKAGEDDCQDEGVATGTTKRRQSANGTLCVGAIHTLFDSKRKFWGSRFSVKLAHPLGTYSPEIVIDCRIQDSTDKADEQKWSRERVGRDFFTETCKTAMSGHAWRRTQLGSVGPLGVCALTLRRAMGSVSYKWDVPQRVLTLDAMVL